MGWGGFAGTRFGIHRQQRYIYIFLSQVFGSKAPAWEIEEAIMAALGVSGPMEVWTTSGGTCVATQHVEGVKAGRGKGKGKDKGKGMRGHRQGHPDNQDRPPSKCFGFDRQEPT